VSDSPELNADPDVERWWHAYGGVTSDDRWGKNVWALFILGESPKHPEQLAADGKLEITTPSGGTFRYLRSFNHDPTEGEKLAITPDEYW
jgi:hypothetical protein